MSAAGFAIGVDLGGGSAKFGLVDQRGAVLNRRQVVIDSTMPADRIAALIVEHMGELAGHATSPSCAPLAAGVAMPGYMDAERTKLLFAANLPTLSGSDFLDRIRRTATLPVMFDADCNAAALAEYRYGAGRGVDRLIVATVGTGIGAGVMIHGRIVRVFNHIAGSLGHVIIKADGPRCACGARGCLEALAAGPALERAAGACADTHPDSLLAVLRRQRGRLGGTEIGEALREGDAGAAGVVDEAGRWLGAGIASWAAIYSPQKVLIGGGIAGLGEPFFSAVRRGVRETGQPRLVHDLVIEPAALGPDAGIIGAAAMTLAGSQGEP